MTIIVVSYNNIQAIFSDYFIARKFATGIYFDLRYKQKQKLYKNIKLEDFINNIVHRVKIDDF